MIVKTENLHPQRGEGYSTFHNFYKEICENSDLTVNDNVIKLQTDLPRHEQNHIESFSYFSTEKFEKNIEYNALDLSILSINVRGIDCNYDNVIMYINSIKYSFDIIALTECHLQLNESYNVDLHNYQPIQGYDKFYTRSRIKYGGVIMYVKSNLKAVYAQELTGAFKTYDSVYVKINMATSSKRPLHVGAYYRHCRAPDIVPFIDKFSRDINHKALRRSDVIIAGDFNICLMKSTTNNDSLYFLNTILANNYEVLILKPTRIQYHKNSLQVRSATLIDQIISNILTHNCKTGNLSYPNSDHYATFAIYESYKSNAQSKIETHNIRKLGNIDNCKLVEDFNSTDWDTLIFNQCDLDIAVENLDGRIQELCDIHAPLTKPSSRMRKHRNKPWIDRELVQLIHCKNRAHVTKTNIPTEKNKKTYELLNNNVTALKRKKKKLYFKEYFDRFNKNSKKMWSGINTALEKTKYKKSLPSVIKDADGKDIEGDKNIAEAFAKYFKAIPGKTKSKIPKFKHPYLHYVKKRNFVRDHLELTVSNCDEVYKHLMKLKDNSSSGPSTVPNKFLKLLGMPLANILTHVINRSMSSGYVPKIMKIGKQTPVHKGGDTCINNYRPITVCTSLAKVLEKVVRDRVTKYIDRVRILNKSQFGFRSKHSTHHAIINLTESTIDELEKELKVGGVYLDIAKAFDTVNHDILLRKLEHYGFRANTLMWFESYLKNRKQYVDIRNNKSSSYGLTWGIPQGGTLAPILFILFINDITNCSNKFHFSIYADDTCLILGIECQDYDEIMTAELHKVVDWFSSNELLLNFSKTDYLHFGPHYNLVYEKGENDLAELHEITPNYVLENPWADETDPNHEEVNRKGEFICQELHKVTPKYLLEEYILMPDNSIINEPESVKYLGVTFDNKLSFKKHMDILGCKINRLVGIFWKCQHLTFEAKKLIYSGLVEAHLNYGIVTWASSLATNISSTHIRDHVPNCMQNIVRIQNKIVRAIFRKPKYDKTSKMHTSVTPLYKELNVMKVSDLYYYNLAILAHDYFHSNTLPEKLAEKLDKNISERVTRNSQLNLQYRTPHNTLMQRKPSTAISAYWNSLPSTIKSCKSRALFKSKLKAHLIESY